MGGGCTSTEHRMSWDAVWELYWYHRPFTAKLSFDCTNNVAKYEACVLGLQAAIEKKIKGLTVYGDFALIICQLNGE